MSGDDIEKVACIP